MTNGEINEAALSRMHQLSNFDESGRISILIELLRINIIKISGKELNQIIFHHKILKKLGEIRR